MEFTNLCFSITDALERERLSQHAALREMVSRGDCAQLKARLSALGSSAGLIANLTPGGANTLLYVASEAGLTAAVSSLLDAGADGRAHPVTKYCPLYIASYHGHVEIAKLLLASFPEAVQQETVEKWLPIHAACIGGHAALVTLLLEYPYPENVLTTYTDPKGEWQWRAAFDVNARDVSGQSALYVACTLGNLAVVDALLAHTVPAIPAHTGDTNQEPEDPPTPVSQALSPQRGGISLGIHAIVSKLTGSSANNERNTSERRIRPVIVEAGRGRDSCVACAARGGHLRLLRRLLAAGADANAEALPPADVMGSGDMSRDRRRSRSASAAMTGARAASGPSPARGAYHTDRDSPWTALAIAARAKNIQVVELLLQHGATDPHCRAIRECARHGLTELLAKLLATKAYPDPDYKLNKSTISEALFSDRAGDSALTYSALCPTTAVMVNWRELRAQLATIRMSWVRAACLRVNIKLGGSEAALHALTRLDVSSNDLRLLPPELFTMLSLRYLNAAQNKLERLPTSEDPFEEDLDSKKKRKKQKTRPEVYSAPVLQEVYLQDNRLEELPASLFRLPSLTTLDVSNNKLRALPAALWTAPALRDLNAALNHLRDLPTGAQSNSECSSPQQLASPTETSPQLSASPSIGSAQFAMAMQSKSSSRSPSIERSESEAVDDDENDSIPVLANRAGNAVWSEARRAHTWRGVVEGAPPSTARGGSALTALNLAHNQFTCVPCALACRAPNLTRLNMAYNSLRSMSYVTSYPTSLRQLDLSHNEITCWPSLPQVESFGSTEGDPLACFCPNPGNSVRSRPRSGGSVRSQLLSAACVARRHLRLEGLRTLVGKRADGLADGKQAALPIDTRNGGVTSALPTF
ncbi:unnamed protein product [Spodoptera exigua]|nr:unnamed protein product [Spodoptera exigua]